MAWLRGLTVCWLVYAACASRSRRALTETEATWPNQTGQRVPHPTTRWGFHDVVGLQLRRLPGQWPLVRHRTEEPQHLLQLLGKPYERLSRCIFPRMEEPVRNVG